MCIRDRLGLLKELIRSTGMSYRTATNGKEALQKLRQEKADLVLTDIQMPDMNGHELLSEINNNPEVPKVPVIALSGQPNISPADYLKEGFKGSLLKPYSSDKLLDLIGEVLSVEFQKNGRKKIVPRDPSKKLSLIHISEPTRPY